MIPEFLYRYEDVSYGVLNEWEELSGNYIKVHERKYKVTKETPCGYWIQLYSFTFKDKKWVSKVARKRFAYPTKHEAMNSFIARKTRQIEIIEEQLKRAKHALWLVSDQGTQDILKRKGKILNLSK